MPRAAAVFLLVLSLVGYRAVAEGAEPLVVAAAASLSDVMKDVAADFERRYQVPVRLNLAGSTTLRVQIEKGMPCDIFVSADALNINTLIDAKFVTTTQPVVLFKNRLVVISPAQDGHHLQGLNQMKFKKGDFLSLADPQTVPAGIYARQALTHAGVWGRIKDDVAPMTDVRQAMTQVEHGNARYGIVYKTDASISKKVAVVYDIPAEFHDPIVYVAAVIDDAEKKRLVPEFFLFLQSAEAKAIYKKYGFLIDE